MKIKPIVSAVVLVALIFWFGYYFHSHIEDFSQLSVVNPWMIAVLIVLFVIPYFLVSVINKELLKILGIYLGYFESFALSIVTGLYNLLTPFRGGMAVRAVYLKKKYNFAYVHFLATLSAVYVLIFLVGSFLGIISTLWIYSVSGIFSWILFLIFGVVFIAMLGIIFISPKFKERKNKWLNRFVNVINGWHLIKKNGRVIVVTTIITLIQVLISSLMLWLQFRVFGVEVSFVSALFLSAIGSLGLIIALTPGNLGVHEAIIVFGAATIGITPTDSLSAALLGRAISLVVLFILGPILSYALFKNGKPGRRGK